MTRKLLIATASWEDRYPLGMLANLEEGDVDGIVVLRSSRFVELTEEHTRTLETVCRDRGVAFRLLCFDFENPVELLRSIEHAFESTAVEGVEQVVVDISTSPRPVVWSTLDALARSFDQVTIRYFAGQTYGRWQTNEEGEPRLVLRRSGIMYPDQPTALILLCGPEISRAEKMCFYFEPKSVQLLRDPRAQQYGTIKELPSEFRSITHETIFDNKDQGDANFAKLDELVQQQLYGDQPCNVVAAALGPKLGALLLYRLSRHRREVGLAYVVSGRHNPKATSGLGERCDIQLRLKDIMS